VGEGYLMKAGIDAVQVRVAWSIPAALWKHRGTTGSLLYHLVLMGGGKEFRWSPRILDLVTQQSLSLSCFQAWVCSRLRDDL